MFLYELALELDEKSLELSARAVSLGLSGAGPNTELTRGQLAALRSNVPMPPPEPAPGEAPIDGSAPLAWGADGKPVTKVPSTKKATKSGLPTPSNRRRPAVDEPPAAKPRKKLPLVELVVYVGCAVLVVGLVVYMATHVGSLDDRKQQLALDNARIDAETKAADTAAATKAAGGLPPSAVPSTPEQQARGLANHDAFCQGQRVVETWIVEFGAAVVQRAEAPKSADVAGWVTAHASELDAAAVQLQGSTTGALHEDATHLAALAQGAGTSLAIAKTEEEAVADAAAWKGAVGDANLQSARARLTAEAAASCG